MICTKISCAGPFILGHSLGKSKDMFIHGVKFILASFYFAEMTISATLFSILTIGFTRCLTHCMMGNFSCFCCCLQVFFQN